MTMLSIITDKKYKNSIFFNVLKDAENKFKAIRNIYKGFYVENVEYQYDPEVQLKYDEIKKILNNTYYKIKKILHETYKKVHTKKRRLSNISNTNFI